jgi:hypothetical protein
MPLRIKPLRGRGVLMFRPRLSIEISEEQQIKLRNMNLPHGWQKVLFNKIVDDIIRINELHGTMGIACVLTDSIAVSDVIATLNKAEKVSKQLKENLND